MTNKLRHEQTKMRLHIIRKKKQNKLHVVHLKYCSDDVNTTYYHTYYIIALHKLN